MASPDKIASPSRIAGRAARLHLPRRIGRLRISRPTARLRRHRRTGRLRMPGPAAWLHLPRRTVRLRLTALYGGLFLICGAGLLAITYLLVGTSTGATSTFYVKTVGSHGESIIQGAVAGTPPTVVGGIPVHSASGAAAGGPAKEVEIHTVATPGQHPPASAQGLQNQARHLTALAGKQHSAELHHLLVTSGIALAIMAVVSIALGWLISGRVLSPLRAMTSATRRISEHNLHQRLALGGPDDELKDLADTIDGLLGRLEAAFEAQRRFVANASHELRTPLAMMRTSLDVAVAKPAPLSPQVGALERKLREGLDQADRLLESFLVLARAQHGALSDQTTVSLARILSAAIGARGQAIALRGIEVDAQLRDVSVSGSETLLSRMVENVIENAVRHNEDGGFIRVRSDLHGTVARVVVESGGPQLDEEKVRELAQPFRRLGADRVGSQDGVGLGLSIVAAIAAAHGGTLALDALPTGGLRVTIELPCAMRAVNEGVLA